MQKTSRAKIVALWIVQLILSASLIWAGLTKLFQSPAQLAAMWPWTAQFPLLVKITGILDLLAGVGLILPSLLNRMSGLVFITALAVIALMIAAGVFHIRRGEASQIGINVVFALLSAFVAWGKRGKDQGGWQQV